MDKSQFNKITKQLDEIIIELRVSNKPESLIKRILNNFVIGASILSILTVFDIIKSWIEGGK